MSHRLPFAVVMVGAALLSWTPGAGAQTTSDPLPPLPPAATPQQATAAPADSATTDLPPLPLGHDGIREVQTQLISLGFDPGPADGENGPATLAAAQRYYESRGGSGPVTISPALLTWLRQDSASRLPPEQVAARARPRYPARAPAPDPLTGAMQQLESGLHRLFNGGY